jgi:hypothetical protein
LFVDSFHTWNTIAVLYWNSSALVQTNHIVQINKKELIMPHFNSKWLNPCNRDSVDASVAWRRILISIQNALQVIFMQYL